MTKQVRAGNGGKPQCSFCGKGQEEGRKLVAGPTAYICDECIEACNDALAEEWQEERSQQSRDL